MLSEPCTRHLPAPSMQGVLRMVGVPDPSDPPTPYNKLYVYCVFPFEIMAGQNWLWKTPGPLHSKTGGLPLHTPSNKDPETCRWLQQCRSHVAVPLPRMKPPLWCLPVRSQRCRSWVRSLKI